MSHRQACADALRGGWEIGAGRESSLYALERSRRGAAQSSVCPRSRSGAEVFRGPGREGRLQHLREVLL